MTINKMSSHNAFLLVSSSGLVLASEIGHFFGSFFPTPYIQTRYEDVDLSCLCDAIARYIFRIPHVQALKQLIWQPALISTSWIHNVASFDRYRTEVFPKATEAIVKFHKK